MTIDARRRYAAAGFIALLTLSVFWPEPVVDVNRLCCHAPLAIDELSFLGREAPSWDVVFWCIAGLFGLLLLHPLGTYDPADFAEPWRMAKTSRLRLRGGQALVPVLLSIVAVALIWRFADTPVTAWAERIQSDAEQDWIRITNRLGGGMNPALIVLFFYLGGVAYRCRRWLVYALGMTLAGAGAGLFAQIIKYAVGRARPELWLGPFQHARPSATSFPSGHTVGAFALAGVLLWLSPSRMLRAVALLLAAGVGLARILAFRHWTSDVVASAAAGLIVAWIVTRGVSQLTKPSGTVL
jgi:membrane-associated phospholipid phosphatase